LTLPHPPPPGLNKKYVERNKIFYMAAALCCKCIAIE